MFVFSNWVDLILKAQGHRYLKRIPYMSGGKRRYRYIYRVTHTHRGRQAFDEAHLVEGTAFMLHPQKGAEFHGHITNVSGDQVTYRIDDGARKGEVVTVSKSELLAQLNDVHDIERGVSAEREKVRAQIEQARKTGSEKQVRRLEERLARLGGEQKRAESEQSVRHGTALSERARAELRAVYEKYENLLLEAHRRDMDDDDDTGGRVDIVQSSMKRDNPKLDALLRKLNRIITKVADPKKLSRGINYDFSTKEDLREALSRVTGTLDGINADPTPLLSRIAELHGSPLASITPDNTQGDYIYNVATRPDLMTANGVGVVYGTVRSPSQGKKMTGLFVLDKATGEIHLLDSSVKAYQAPYVLDFYARHKLYMHARDKNVGFERMMSDEARIPIYWETLATPKKEGSIGEFVARVLQADKKRKR